MKTLLTLLWLFLLTSFSAAASSADTTSRANKFYLSAGVTTVTFHIYYKNPETLGEIKSGYFTPIALSLGYKASERVRMQMGLGYGGSKADMQWSLNHKASDTVRYSASSRTHVLAVPISLQTNLFKAFRRIPIYGTVTATTAFGNTKASSTEILHEVSSTTKVRDSGVNLFVTAGFGMNYNISNHLTGYAEWLPFKSNLTSRNSAYYDWEQHSPLGRRIFKSLAIGVNYSL